jgi:glycosyltransferase involved in cell wall biosynthesis
MAFAKHSERSVTEALKSYRKLLLVAYHFPPQSGSSGHLRSLKYCRYLLEYGWRATVLSVHPRAYDQTNASQLPEIPREVKVVRAFALDSQKHLSIRGRYFRYVALPDRWVPWCLGGIPAGLWQIYRGKCEVILSTFPIATAVLIGLVLNRLTGVPWIVDLRDSMTEDDYPRDRRTRRVLRWLEGMVVQHASRLIFTAPSARHMYLQRYPDLSAEKCLLISNGFDEADFQGLSPRSELHSSTMRLLHFGLIYREERNPIPFFRALSRLKQEGKIEASWFSVELRACGNEKEYQDVVKSLHIEDIVHFLPSIPYRQALEDANSVHALLLLQGADCDHQIPAKTYEYLRLRKPILALTSHNGDTAMLLRECGGATIVDISDEDAISRALEGFITSVREKRHSLPQPDAVSTHSRSAQARDLALCLSELAGVRTPEVAAPVQHEAELRS